MPPSSAIARPGQKGWLGVLLKESDPIKNLGEIKIKFPSQSVIPALEIIGVFPNSPASKAGILVGDKILAVDDELISGPLNLSLKDKFSRQITISKIGMEICLHIFRNQKMRKFFVPILSRPKAEVVQKIHPEFSQEGGNYSESFLYSVLKKKNLLDEYFRTASEIFDRASNVIYKSLNENEKNPFRLREVNYLLENPMDLPLVSEKMVAALEMKFSQKYSNIAGLLKEAMNGLDIEPSKIDHKRKTQLTLPEFIDSLLNALGEASVKRAEALSRLTVRDFEFLHKNFSANDSVGFSKAKLERLLEITLKVDISKLINTSIGIARVLDTQVINFSESSSQPKFPPNWKLVYESDFIRVMTPNGTIILGGEGNNVYKEDALLIIDLGGDDIYLNNAGASTEEFPYSVLIDFSGNDLYMSSKNVSQGSGFLGGGFLIDLSGNDRYITNNFSQGSGFLGTGLLADLSGHDEYSCQAYCQASGIFGIGLLAEAQGDDNYFADIFSQGVGLTKGYGALIEAGGDDNYYAGGVYPDHRQPNKAFLSMSQGFGYGFRPEGVGAGSSGGIGIIADHRGDDTYIGDYFGQGSSYWYALGILSDKNGDDKYIAGRYSQGAGVHHSAGILSDLNGDDEYFVHYGVSQGCGHDLAIGMLLDNGGDDKYIGGTISQGAGNGNGFGIFNDNGGKDEYTFSNPGQGSGHYLPFRDLGSLGVFIDTGGEIDIYHDEEKNNQMIFKNNLGIFADTK